MVEPTPSIRRGYQVGVFFFGFELELVMGLGLGLVLGLGSVSHTYNSHTHTYYRSKDSEGTEGPVVLHPKEVIQTLE